MPFFRQTAPIVIVATLAAAMYDYIRMWDVIGVIGNFTLHVSDLVFGLTMIYCSAWAMRRWRHSPLEYLNLLLCGVLVLNFARGIIAVGVGAAGVHFRLLYAGYVGAASFVFLMHRQIDIQWVLDKFVLLGWGIVALSAARLVFGLNAFIAPEFLGLDPELYGLERTLNSGAALMLGEATLIVLSRIGTLPAASERRRVSATLVIFFATLLISNQRTATFATLAGMGVVLAAWPRRRRSVVLAAGSFVLVITSGAVYGTWIAAAGDIASILPRSIVMLGSDWSFNNETYEWRVTQWQDYMDFYGRETAFDRIIGLPAGAVQSAAVYSDMAMLQVTVHSGYVALLMDAGLVGVALFVAMLVVGVAKGVMALRRGPGAETSPSDVGLAIALLVTYAVFSYTYVVSSNEHSLLLAIALQIIATAPRSAGRPALSRRGRRTAQFGAVGVPVSLRTRVSDPRAIP
jgi:O-antigen ligase